MQLTKTQEQYAMSLIRRFGGVDTPNILSVLRYHAEDDWVAVMHTLTTTQPGWFA